VRVLVTGASGLIGSALVDALGARGDEAVGLGRDRTRTPWWDVDGDHIEGSLDGFDAVVHLAGESIGARRWTDEQKARIHDSRTKSTDLLARTLAASDRKPRVLVSGSAVGYYGSDKGREHLLDESSEPGDDFLAHVCRDWEAATQPADDAGIRVAHARTGIVLSPRGGVLQRLLVPYRLGAGGKTGSGRQYMSWITLADEVRAILHVIDHDELAGSVNLTAPHPVTNEVFAKLLGEALHRPAIIPTPTLALRAVYGRELVDTLLVGGQRVFPKRLEASGFEFDHPTLEAALRALLARS
jgi:uncharacterized protein (TIGR01777 family)